MNSIFRIISFVFAGAILLYVFLTSLSSAQGFDTNLTIATLIATPQNTAVEQPQNIDELPLRDNPDVYLNDDPASVVTIYATIRKGDSVDGTDYTWEQVNDFVKDGSSSTPDIRTEAIIQFGDESGPLPGELGYSAIAPNAIIEIRGLVASRAPQKSYRIELFNSTGTWRDQSIINLNKHVNDVTRFRNKLSFDLLKQVPDMISLRTQFVHLYVKDETTDPPQTRFVDYGLYTQIEQPNKRFLESRFLDRDGQYYKASDFDFSRYPDQIRLATDPLYDEDAFSLILEIKGSRDHSKLIQMLNDINNENIPIEQTFSKYFNADNYFTWMAFNILLGNIDTQSQNFFLYSPRNGTKWYFLPWDYDNSFPLQNHPEFRSGNINAWEHGVSNYWDVILHRRVLEVAEYRQALDQKIDELLILITPLDIYNLVNVYLPVVEKHVLVMPDRYYLPADLAVLREIALLIPDDIDTNYELYRESLETPLPFFLGTPTLEGNTITFTWDEAYDFEDSDIRYEFTLGKDWAFEDIVYEQTLEDVDITSIQIDMLPMGKYFWKVTATNEDGYTQYAFDSYTDLDNQSHSGVKTFYVTPDGEVIE